MKKSLLLMLLAACLAVGACEYNESPSAPEETIVEEPGPSVPPAQLLRPQGEMVFENITSGVSNWRMTDESEVVPRSIWLFTEVELVDRNTRRIYSSKQVDANTSGGDRTVVLSGPGPGSTVFGRFTIHYRKLLAGEEVVDQSTPYETPAVAVPGG